MITKLRQSLTRILFPIGVLLALGTLAAPARDQTEAPGAGITPPQASDGGVIETIAAIVHGLSGNDLLNVRATASPIGLVLARIPNGTMVTRLECSTTRNTEWCRVEVPDLDGLVGWTPARYLQLARAEDEPAEELPGRLPEQQVIDPSQIIVGILPDPLPRPDDPLAESVASPVGSVPDLQTALLAPASDAPSNGPALFDTAREARKIDGAATDLALAYATRSDAAVSEVYSAIGAEADRSGNDPASVTDTAASTVMPLPSPRPARETEPGSSAGPESMVAAFPSPDATLPSSDAEVADGAEPPAAPVEQEAPANDEQEAPGSMTEAEPEGASAPDQPSEADPQAPASPDISVAVMTPFEDQQRLASPSPDAVEPSKPSVATASSEPGAGPDDADGSEQTLREQLAALLPSWSRPAVPAPTVSDKAGPTVPLEGTAGHSAVAHVAAVPAETPSPPAPIVPPSVEVPSPIETVAETRAVDPVTPASVTVAEIPCARYAGQPMTRCEARIVRIDENDADVTILWPDGGERLIRFRGGEPDSANGRGEFRFTREAELNLIRIGSGERFEILDALPFAE